MMLRQVNFLQSQSWTPCTGWLALRWSLDKSQDREESGQPTGPGPASDADTGEDRPLLHSCSFTVIRSSWRFYLAAFVSKLSKMPKARRLLSRLFFRKRLWRQPQNRFPDAWQTYFLSYLPPRRPVLYLWAILQACKFQTLGDYK